MNIIPAIDLYNNHCVRLNKGQFDQATQYSDDPVRCAQHFNEQGAPFRVESF